MILTIVGMLNLRLLLVGGLLILLLAVAISVVYTKHIHRQNFSELQEIKSKRDDMNFEWWQLQLERSTVAAGRVIENVAREKLGMNHPGNKEVILIKP